MSQSKDMMFLIWNIFTIAYSSIINISPYGQ